MKKLTLEELKDIIVEYSHQNKIYPSARYAMEHIEGIPNKYHTYVNWYGTPLRKIIDTCDIPYKFRHRQFDYSDKDIIETYRYMAEVYGKAPGFTEIEEYRISHPDVPSVHTILGRFGSLKNLADICNFKLKMTGKKINKEFLIDELKRFNKEFLRIPTQKDFSFSTDYPSRKTFSNTFGTFNNALRAAGFDVSDRPEYTRDYLLSEIERYIREFGRQPFSREFDTTKGYPSKSNYQKVFGSWNNAIKELGLTVRASQYSNEELDAAFFHFVEKFGRPPTLHEFNNNNEYPSFWCYQDRFGSWNKTLIHYGFDVNQGTAGTYYHFSNGEICKSTYEFDTSSWLRNNNISYWRNVPYRDFIDSYDGRKDCDYVIMHNEEWIWLEIAGLYTSRAKKSNMELAYVKAFEHKKENLLSQFNYKIFYPDDFKNHTLDELFSFLWVIPEVPWGNIEPIYQGMPEEIFNVR